MRWAELEADVPEIAAEARRRFEDAGMALIGTLRRDGSPRISCVDPCLLDGEIYLGMMWRSRKAVDLLRDPRLVLHNAICTNRGDEVEVILHGNGAEVGIDGTIERYLSAVPGWRGRRLHLFRVELEAAALIRYESGRQHVQVWPRGVRFVRPY
jgi:Pyridoxamine 5'-phosphate oxidase